VLLDRVIYCLGGRFFRTRCSVTSSIAKSSAIWLQKLSVAFHLTVSHPRA